MSNVFLEGLQRPAILQNNSGLPDYSEANDGDVLQIASGEPTWGAVDGLPEIEETDEGKVLAVDQGEAVWADAPSGLPEITNADEGKVLTVVGEAETTELFSEQSLTVQGTDEQIIPATVQNANLSIFVDGETVRCTVDGTEYEATIESGLAVFDVDESAYILRVTDSTMTFTAPSEGTYTVSAVVLGDGTIYSAQWGEASGGGNILEFSSSLQTALLGTVQAAVTAAATGGFSNNAYQYTFYTGGTGIVTESDYLKAKAAVESILANGTPVYINVQDVPYIIEQCASDASEYSLTTIIPVFRFTHEQLGDHILRITVRLTLSYGLIGADTYGYGGSGIAVVEHLCATT